MTRIMQRAGGLVATVTRSFALDDIQRDKTGDGRTVTAYAAVFDQDAEIHDRDGHYLEQIARSAFNQTLSHRGTNFGVFYNHGKTLYGTPSDRATVPLGTPLEVRVDGRGLLTVTRYNTTPLADDVLAAIDNGDIRGQSFTGRIVQSTPNRGPFRPSRNGDLTLVTRREIALVEYGPTPFPAYDTADIVGRRSLDLSDADELDLLRMVLLDVDDDAGARLTAAISTARAEALAVLSEVIGKKDNDGDTDELRERLQSLAAQLETFSGTPDPGGASAGALAHDEHSAPKLTPAQAQIRARLHAKGLR